MSRISISSVWFGVRYLLWSNHLVNVRGRRMIVHLPPHVKKCLRKIHICALTLNIWGIGSLLPSSLTLWTVSQTRTVPERPEGSYKWPLQTLITCPSEKDVYLTADPLPVRVQNMNSESVYTSSEFFLMTINNPAEEHKQNCHSYT